VKKEYCTPCDYGFTKVYKDHIYWIRFEENIWNVLDPYLAMNSNFQDSLKNVLSFTQSYEEITITYSSYIRKQKIQHKYPNINESNKEGNYIEAYSFKNLSQYKGYSVFWYKYLGYENY